MIHFNLLSLSNNTNHNNNTNNRSNFSSKRNEDNDAESKVDRTQNCNLNYRKPPFKYPHEPPEKNLDIYVDSHDNNVEYPATNIRLNYLNDSMEITNDLGIDNRYMTLDNMPNILNGNNFDENTVSKISTSTASIWYDLLLELPNLPLYKFKFPTLNILNNNNNDLKEKKANTRHRLYRHYSLDQNWNKYTGYVSKLIPIDLDINNDEDGYNANESDNVGKSRTQILKNEYDYDTDINDDIFENNAVLNLQQKRHKKRSRKFKKRSKFNLATFKIRQLWLKGKVPILTNEYLNKPVIRFGLFKGIMDKRHNDCLYLNVSNHKHTRQKCLCQTWTHQASPLRYSLD